MKNNNSSISGFILMILSGWNSFCLLLTVFKRVVYKHQMSCCGWSSLTASVCRGRRSRTPPPLEAPPGGEWHRTRMGCVCRCGTPCGCTDRSPPARLRKAYSPRSPRRCPRHSSPHGSFSERDVENLRKMLYECSLRSVTSSMHDEKKKGTTTFSLYSFTERSTSSIFPVGPMPPPYRFDHFSPPDSMHPSVRAVGAKA